jgi:hypothetical protein
MRYRLVRYQSKFLDQIVRLQTGLWSRDLATNAAYFSWKYHQNPYISEPLICVALQKDRVVAMRGFHGSQWAIGESGQTVTLPCAGDTIIAPKHRRRGLLRQMLQFEWSDGALAAFPYALSFSASPIVYFCSLSEGWQSIGAYNALARPSPIQRLLKSKRVSKWVQKRNAAVTKLWRAASHLRPNLSRGRVRTSFEPRAAEMATLVAATAQHHKIHQHKDSRYYAWRFGSPLSRYQFFYWQDTALEGFLVVRPHRSKIGPAELVDWAASSPEVFTELLDAAISYAGLGGLQIWSATLPESVAIALKARGFAPTEHASAETGYRPSLLGRRMDATPTTGAWNLAGLDIADLNNWDLRMASSDQY